MIEELFGLTEICGVKGVGKTNLCISISTNTNTVYISSKKFPIARYNQLNKSNKTFLINEIATIDELLSIVNYKLEQVIIKHKIEMVVVDSLTHLIETEKKSKKLYSVLIEIIKKFKRIIYEYFVVVVIVNDLKESNRNVKFDVMTGCSWLYYMNTRMLVTRNMNLRFAKVDIDFKGRRCNYKIEIGNDQVIIEEL